MAAAVKVAIMAWNATRMRFMVFYAGISLNKETVIPHTYFSPWPIVRISICRLRNGLNIESAMTSKQILLVCLRDCALLL